MLLCGSKALEYWLKDKFWRACKDTDYLCKFEEIPEELQTEDNKNKFIISNLVDGIEYLIVDDCEELIYIYNNNVDKEYLDLESCLILKNAHKHFYLGKYKKSFKHVNDYSNLIKHATLDRFQEDLSLCYRKWLIENVYDSDPRLTHFPKLDKTKDQFFNDHVIYYVDHDLIHEKVAIGEKPAYTYCLTGEVMFSNKLFNELEYLKKVHMVLEESFVLAIERCLLPLMNGNVDIPAASPTESFKYALTRVATNITSGDFRAFASDNFSDIYQVYLDNYTNYYHIIKDL